MLAGRPAAGAGLATAGAAAGPAIAGAAAGPGSAAGLALTAPELLVAPVPPGAPVRPGFPAHVGLSGPDRARGGWPDGTPGNTNGLWLDGAPVRVGPGCPAGTDAGPARPAALVELRAPADASRDFSFVTAQWARRWPSEHVVTAVKRG